MEMWLNVPSHNIPVLIYHTSILVLLWGIEDPLKEAESLTIAHVVLIITHRVDVIVVQVVVLLDVVPLVDLVPQLEDAILDRLPTDEEDPVLLLDIEMRVARAHLCVEAVLTYRVPHLVE